MAPAQAAALRVVPARKAKRFDRYAAQIRMLAVLVLAFAVVPGALLLSVGVLVLVFGQRPHDTVFGVLILALAATLVAGITATLLYIRKGTSLARLQTEFVQNVSHDLRTPLTAIRMFVEMLQDRRISDAAKIGQCLNVLGRETERLSLLVERLLEWARMEAGSRMYRLAPVKVAALVDRAIEALEAQLALGLLDCHVRIQRQRAADAAVVEVDPEAMTEALLNILQNAVVHTGPSKEIEVRSARRNDGVCITIADNGPGIPLQEQRRIFQKFHRVVDPAIPNVRGTGLGLAIVHNIVRAHRGRVTVESELGHGAAFQVWLPLGDGGTA
jgi:two-component system, OmpR family, phosphate regulon sensor histidine kinase PhoR